MNRPKTNDCENSNAIHLDLLEYSDSESYSSSSSSSNTEDEDQPAWLEKVGTKGDLFYIEPAVSVESEAQHVFPEAAAAVNSTTEKELQTSDSKAKAAEKLRMWMKRRRNKMKKKFSETASASFDIENISKTKNKHKVKQQIFPYGEIKEVYLNIDPKRHNYGRRATLSEKLFGILISTFNETDGFEGVVICGLTPDGEASKEGTIGIGDLLKSVDDKEVTYTNLNDVLGTITSARKVKLTIQKCSTSNSLQPASPNSTNCSVLSKYVISDLDTFDRVKANSVNTLHAAFYLTLNNESEEAEEDVLYKYPVQDSSLCNLKGMFITLGHMISSVATPPLLSCSLLIQEKLIHVGFYKEGSQLFVLAIPSRCATVTEVHHFTSNIAKLLKLQFLSLLKCFSDSENKEYLDSFFELFFYRMFSPLINEYSHHAQSHLLSVLPSVHWFPLPADLKVQIDDILSEFESADFGDQSDGYYGIRRLYNILGTCFFYKSYLLGSHLHKDDLLDIHIYLQYHNLLYMSRKQPLSQAIIWKEIYLSRFKCNGLQRDPDYEEVTGRTFLLIVAMKYSVVAVILEAGGCAMSITGYPSPEPFYVEQVQNIIHLFENTGISPMIDKLLEAQIPHLACPNSFLKEEKASWNIFTSFLNRGASTDFSSHLNSKRSLSHSNLLTAGSGSMKSLESNSVLKKSAVKDFERQNLFFSTGSVDGESDAETNTSAAASDEILLHRQSRTYSISNSSNTGSHESEENIPLKFNRMKRTFASSHDLSSLFMSQDLEHHHQQLPASTKLVSGSENTLFHYIHMDPFEGIFLAPTSQVQKLLQSAVNEKITQSFYQCCLSMRTTFERSLRNKELITTAVTPKFGLNDFLQAVQEQGALFQLTFSDEDNQKKTQNVLNFWVIGRLFFKPEPREVYVCYHDSSQQNVVEMAFRLGFGLSL